jgi:hypothetical protein
MHLLRERGRDQPQQYVLFSHKGSILLVSMRTRDLVDDVNFSEEIIQFLIFSTPITYINNLSIEHQFNKRLKFLELLNHFRFKFKKINPSKSIIIIHKAYIIFVSINKLGCRAKHKKYKF